MEKVLSLYKVPPWYKITQITLTNRTVIELELVTITYRNTDDLANYTTQQLLTKNFTSLAMEPQIVNKYIIRDQITSQITEVIAITNI